MFSTAPRTETLARLRGQIARIERNGAPMPHGTVPFGIAVVDTALPGGGLARGALHEFAGSGPDTEHGAAAAQFIGGVLARMEGPVLWVQQRADLFAPGLACIGLHPARVLFADAGKEVLAAMEEGLAHPGLAAVVGEYTGKLTLVASRRLQLAAEQSGAMAALLRRSQTFDDPAFATPSAAVTRWRIAALPSPPPIPLAPSVPGLGLAVWRLDLTRCRGGSPGSWIVEACDATGRLNLVTPLGYGSAEVTEHAA